jgi:hypothetical protein
MERICWVNVGFSDAPVIHSASLEVDLVPSIGLKANDPSVSSMMSSRALLCTDIAFSLHHSSVV